MFKTSTSLFSSGFPGSVCPVSKRSIPLLSSSRELSSPGPVTTWAQWPSSSCVPRPSSIPSKSLDLGHRWHRWHRKRQHGRLFEWRCCETHWEGYPGSSNRMLFTSSLSMQLYALDGFRNSKKIEKKRQLKYTMNHRQAIPHSWNVATSAARAPGYPNQNLHWRWREPAPELRVEGLGYSSPISIGIKGATPFTIQWKPPI
jgi:hypothetical protein